MACCAIRRLIQLLTFASIITFFHAQSQSAELGRDELPCAGNFGGKRVVCADVAAFDQMLVYNRFGSFNPFGMMFALKRDLSQADLIPADDRGNVVQPDADFCDTRDGTEWGKGKLEEGNVRLKDCKRPRPIVLRAAAGDILKVRLTNFLAPQPGFTETFCQSPKSAAGLATTKSSYDRVELRGKVSESTKDTVDHGEASCVVGSDAKSPGFADPLSGDTDWPRTRGITFAVQGLTATDPSGDSKKVDQACLGLRQIMPGPEHAVTCYYQADREGTYFLSSTGAPAGGEGDGGSVTHGLFGAVMVEPADSQWFRSQVSKEAFNAAWPASKVNLADNPHIRDAAKTLDYQEKSDKTGLPILNLVHSRDGSAVELIHTDLNAIIYRDGYQDCPLAQTNRDCALNFREFSVFFHDELKTFYSKNFEELGKFGQLAGARDGFGINYGASGMGTLLLANRKGIGPAADCIECLYEEFFLASWANGDPALLENYSDDPSNVHHSYINDRTVFRNFHAGPKETHVFHLHAHQWFAGNDPNRGAYLDSQTVGPEQGFSYDIYHGGLPQFSPMDPTKKKGWWQSVGAGNRNRAPGDSIFHCHLYPHFAQGMWELWRNHDVLEDGTRKLPDGQLEPGYSVAFNDKKTMSRPGSVDQKTGQWSASPTGKNLGTPIPALVPLPDQALPLLPTYTADATGMPGYPFYIAGQPGHRPPQAPLDIALENGKALDGGLPRHVVKSGIREFEVAGAEKITDPTKSVEERERAAKQYVAKVLSLGNFASELKTAEIAFPGAFGSDLEQAAMGFHYNGYRVDYDEGTGKLETNLTKLRKLNTLNAQGTLAPFNVDEGSYPSLKTPKPLDVPAAMLPAYFATNGAPPKPGAPFADPCAVASGMNLAGRHANGTPQDVVLMPQADPLVSDGSEFVADPGLTGFRRFEASAVQVDLVTNRAGWHDPQGRINVLTKDSPSYKPGKVSATEKPFFFRALSGECIEFRHTNELPKDLELDDFQVKTPTDTIGQHIHLVKFDVTASDGSGNGWNYEDGTFAPDEVVSRICASTGDELANKRNEYCKKIGEIWVPKDKAHWKSKLGDRSLQPFQTTTQRWFADPMLSNVSDGDDKLQDRTMRTVFTHDHFGPSSIQQHGFYSALVIEPQRARVCDSEKDPAKPNPANENIPNCSVEFDSTNAKTIVAVGDETMIGVAKQIRVPPKVGDANSIHTNYREYALAVADFATLYDPQDLEKLDDFEARQKHEVNSTAEAVETKGMETLLCEAQRRKDVKGLEKFCGSALKTDETATYAAAENSTPAWIAGGMVGDIESHKLGEDILVEKEIEDLKKHLITHRKLAAGCVEGAECDKLAKPVAAPKRPESISVDHHDPYLVNYRGEPIPLRVGTKSNGSAPCTKAKTEDWVENGRLVKAEDECSVSKQRTGDEGDMANVFVSAIHGDPATPVIETYDNDPVVLRLIQGAQEVQHVFNLDGYSWTRNIDQHYPAGSRPLDDASGFETAYQKCIREARFGRALEYQEWFDGKRTDQVWLDHEERIARCDNLNGRTTAQEIGISEHFEFRGKFRQSVAGAEFAPADAAAGASSVSITPNMTDYHFHFGSSDDLWNGAWGLLRVYANDAALDMRECIGSSKNADGRYGKCESPKSIGKRLFKFQANPGSEIFSLADSQIVEALRTSGFSPISKAVSCKVDEAAEEAFAAAIAITARQVWGKTNYGNSLFDPDGLVLVHLAKEELPGFETVNNRDVWEVLWQKDGEHKKVAQLIDIIRSKYPDGPLPFTLDVKAGSCVNLAVINAMDSIALEGHQYLRDALGDALMPPITPLNTDPSLSNDGQTFDTVNGLRDASNLRPSARLALRLQLPVMNDPQSVSMPTGWNLTGALAPGAETINMSKGERPEQFAIRDQSAELLTFYAGQLRLVDYLGDDSNKLTMALKTACGVLLDDKPSKSWSFNGKTLETKGDSCLTPQKESDADLKLGNANINLIVSWNGGSKDTLRNTLASFTAAEKASFKNMIQSDWEPVAAKLLSDDSHWMPYASGPIPIKSFGDVIGQPTHGLFGVVNVVPNTWKIDRSVDKAGPSQKIPTSRYVYGDRNIREFTLTLQDGLGLLDTNSGLRPLDKKGMQLAENVNGTLKPIHPVPDCKVCDDSYDFGEKAVNYRSAAFGMMLREMKEICPQKAEETNSSKIEANTDLNSCVFPSDFFLKAKSHGALVLNACAGEELVMRVVHPGGRQRQHTFTTIGFDYDDLFPSFGFAHSALLGPGKVVTASVTKPAQVGTYLWFDGTATLRDGGVWGLLDVKSCQ